MDNNYNNDQNNSGGAEPEPQYGGQHSFKGNISAQYDTQSVGSYDPQQSAPNYGGAPMNGGYSDAQQSAPNYGGAPMNGGYSNAQQSAPNYGGAPMNGGYSNAQQSAPNYGGQPMNGGYSDAQQSVPNYGGAPMNGGYSDAQQSAPNYGGTPMNGGYGYPNGQPYTAPNYYGGFKDPYGQPVPDESGGRGIAALVVGILSWLDWCIPVLGLCTSLIGLILGIQGRKGGKKGLAIAGIVLSSISGLFGVFFNIGFVIRIIQEASGV
ncbi:DUF4190 domain-containing protein [Ruminococcus flavefaciens]|uniref:DUF4190 domain-containing protein n=1 Tax=Ruminococcus flavefaciens TaxID=1265 RepID=UPI0013DD824A|nr:hypothetical protein [Ruminococcus flavefaciens]